MPSTSTVASGIALAQTVGGREQRIDVAGGSPAGEQIDGHRAAAPRRIGSRDPPRRLGRCRANDSTTPIAVSVVMSADPPADTSGSGTPSTGSRPSTTAMLTNAWPITQTIAALVASLANGSRDIRMMRTKQMVEHDEQRQHQHRAEQAQALRR